MFKRKQKRQWCIFNEYGLLSKMQKNKLKDLREMLYRKFQGGNIRNYFRVKLHYNKFNKKKKEDKK